MKKQKLRKQSLALRARLTDRPARDMAIKGTFLAQPFYRDAKVIMTYLSYLSEPDTHALVSDMLAAGKTVCAPVCGEKGEMEAYAFSSFSQLAPSKMGILEPKTDKQIFPGEIDVIIVPGCAFCDGGYRLGYGGGYYDRYLPRTNAVTCGFLYEPLKINFTPDKTDIPLDYIITEQRIYQNI